MMLAFLLTITTALGAPIEIQDLPWRSGQSTVFVADFDLDTRGEVAVLTGNRLDVFERNRRDAVFSLAMPEGTAVIDVLDANQDGTADIIAVSGADILRIPVSTDDEENETVVCFSRESQYSDYVGIPFPGVLVVMREKTPLVALPCDDALELRTLEGKLIDSYPIGMAAPRRLSLGQPFSVWANPYAQLAGPGALEFRVSSVSTYKPLLPDHSLPIRIAEPSGRLGTARQQREAATLEAERWPWFTINTNDTRMVRALYARSDAPGGETLMRVRHVPVDSPTGSNTGDDTGPLRRYPGLLLRHPEVLPDFDGDGFHDLLLWKSKRIAPTVDGLARAVAKGTWPIWIIAHRYAPEKKRFSDEPFAQIEVALPLGWYLNSGGANPFRTILLNDMDGDQQSDFGCLVDEQTLAIWRSGPEGVESEPGFRHRFPEAVLGVEFEEDLEGQGRKTIVLRSQNHLYLLRPNTTFAP